MIAVVDRMPNKRKTPTSIGANLRRIREARGMSQGDLGRAAGVARPTITRIEVGQRVRPGLPTMQRLADALGCSVGELVGEEAVKKIAPKEALPPTVELTGGAIETYLASPYAQIDRPTFDEIRWLQEVAPHLTYSGGFEINPEALHNLLKARRAGRVVR